MEALPTEPIAIHVSVADTTGSIILVANLLALRAKGVQHLTAGSM